ncbi:hypothetical protein HanIR_Chr09g0398551 [Helianthus annuus]|nr:hypothetical protein HanIR_Chr09g0398551 [Helianthus annuus]
MSSSEGSNIYDDVDPMTPSSDDDYIPEVQVITSDSETGSDSDMDDFQPFAYLGDIVDDDVLAVPPPLNDIVIIGHPEGEHIVEIIPLDVLPLAMVPFVDLDEDDDDIVPVIPVEHIDDDLGDGDVYDLVILDVAAPVVPIIVLSSDSDTDSDAPTGASVTSSALLAVGLHRYAVELDDVLPDEPVVPAPGHIPTPPHSLAHLPAEEPSQALFPRDLWTVFDTCMLPLSYHIPTILTRQDPLDMPTYHLVSLLLCHTLHLTSCP